MIVKIQKLKTFPKVKIQQQKNFQKHFKQKQKQINYIQCKKCNMVLYKDNKIEFALIKNKWFQMQQIKTILNSRCCLQKNIVFFCRKCGKMVGILNNTTNLIQVCQQSVKFHYIYLKQKGKTQKNKFGEPYQYSGKFEGLKPKFIIHYIFKSLFLKTQKYKLIFQINDKIIARNNSNFYRRALFLLEEQYNKDVKQKPKDKTKQNLIQEMKYMQSTKAQTSQFNTKFFKTIKNNTIFTEQKVKSINE